MNDILTSCNQIGRIALLMGGHSSEAEISRRGAERVAGALDSLGIEYVCIDVVDSPSLGERLSSGEFSGAFNLVHGEFGEDGALVAFLESFGIAHSGTSAASAMLCFDKNLCKSVWRCAGLPTPDWSVLPASKLDVLPSIEFPAVCKPVRSGSSLGVEFVDDAQSLQQSWERNRHYGNLMIESRVEGREYSTSFIQGHLLPTIELVVEGEFYDYKAKYVSGATRYLPAPHIDADDGITGILERAWQALDCRAWGRIDYICGDDDAIQLLEINSIPGMGSHSLLPKSAAMAGYSYEQTVAAIAANIEVGQ